MLSSPRSDSLLLLGHFGRLPGSFESILLEHGRPRIPTFICDDDFKDFLGCEQLVSVILMVCEQPQNVLVVSKIMPKMNNRLIQAIDNNQYVR